MSPWRTQRACRACAAGAPLSFIAAITRAKTCVSSGRAA